MLPAELLRFALLRVVVLPVVVLRRPVQRSARSVLVPRRLRPWLRHLLPQQLL
jgi:hypothetical protein